MCRCFSGCSSSATRSASELGTEITVSETSVSSLRKDHATGKLAMVQVKGGMNPGNSGGPVVDVEGQRGRRRGRGH